MDNNMPVISAKNLNLWYGDFKALKGISLDVGEQEITALIGPSGCGKSTFLKTLNRMNDLVPNVRIEGDVRLRGEDIFSKEMQLTDLRRRVGMVFQYPEHQLFENTVLADVCFGPMNQGLSREQAEEEAKKALAHVGVKEENFTKSPFELSGGQKKRVAIAGVLAMNPKILILDEPTAGLDPQGRDDILDQIAALHKMRGITIILVSHSMEDIAKYVERLIVMNHGEMVFDDTPKNVFSHYKELEGMGLAAPQITYIMHALSENGLNVDTTATTVEEARDTILEALKKQKPSLLKKGGRSE